MSLFFGPIRQISYVSRDIDRSMVFFAEKLGIGPWFVVRRHRMENCVYRGAPMELEFSLALSGSGSLEFEIVQQHDDGPSVYRDFIATSPEGLHVQHMAFRCADVDAYMARLREGGFACVQEGLSPKHRHGYFTHPDEPDLCVEISAVSEKRARMFAAIQRLAAEWDGADPVREGFPRPD